MKQFLFFCFLVGFFCSGLAQQEKLASLKLRLATEDDSSRIETLLEIARIYQKKALYNPEKKGLFYQTFSHASKVIDLAKTRADTASLLEAMELTMWYHRRKRESTKTKKVREKLMHLRSYFGYDIQRLKRRSSSMIDQTQVRLYDECWIYLDSTNELTIDSLLLNCSEFAFQTQEQARSAVPKLNIFQGTIWLKVRLQNSSPNASIATFFHNRHNRTWQQIDIYIPKDDRTYVHLQTGKSLPDSVKNIPKTSSHFQVFVEGKSDMMMFLRLQGIDAQSPPSDVSLTHTDYYQTLHEVSKRRHINGIFQGVIFIQFLFFLILFFSTGDKVYGYYSFYIGGLTLFTLTLNYYMNFFLNQRVSPLILYMIGIWMATVGILKFSSAYLNFEKILPKWQQPLRVFILVFTGLCFGFLLFGITLSPNDLSDKSSFSAIMIFGVLTGLITLMILTSAIFLIIWGVQALQKNYDPARYYLIASFFLLLAILIPAVLSLLESTNPTVLDWFPTEILITIFQAGVVLQLSCFALAVGHNRNMLVKSQKDALTQQLELQERINAATERFVPYEFLTSLGRDSILEVNLGDQVEKEVSVFFADIRNYTTMAENMTPKENFSFLNAYLGRVGPVIKANRGFVNQYYGDGIMALFMSTETNVNSARDAVETAIEVQHIIRDYSNARVNKNRLPLRIGIGIHSGPLMLGVIGDETRMDVGVVSDAVNTASRMEGLTKHFGASILVSESTLFGIDNPRDFQYRFLGLVQVKGKKEPLSVYEFFEGDPPEVVQLKAETLSIFEAGLTAYFARDFKKSRTAFKQVLDSNPQDQVARLYMKRCQDLIIKGMPQGWTGVETW